MAFFDLAGAVLLRLLLPPPLPSLPLRGSHDGAIHDIQSENKKNPNHQKDAPGARRRRRVGDARELHGGERQPAEPRCASGLWLACCAALACSFWRARLALRQCRPLEALAFPLPPLVPSTDNKHQHQHCPIPHGQPPHPHQPTTHNTNTNPQHPHPPKPLQSSSTRRTAPAARATRRSACARTRCRPYSAPTTRTTK